MTNRESTGMASYYYKVSLVNVVKLSINNSNIKSEYILICVCLYLYIKHKRQII